MKATNGGSEEVVPASPLAMSASASSCNSQNSSSSNLSSPLLPRLISGSIGSIATALAVTPLEVVKIRQQAAGANHNYNIAPRSFRGIKVEPCPGCGTLVLNNGLMECVLPVESTSLGIGRSSSLTLTSTAPARASGTLSTLLSIFRNEGYSGLYAGLKPTLVMGVPNTVLYFTAYDEISLRLRKHHVANSNNNSNSYNYNNSSRSTLLLSPLEEEANSMAMMEENAKRQPYIPLIAGASSRLLASLATAPLELIRTRQASIVGNRHHGQRVKVPGMMEDFRTLTRTNGLSSLYVGLSPTLWRDVPFSALYWLAFERLKNELSSSTELGVWGKTHYREQGIKVPPSIEAMHAFVSGAAAGSIAAAFTTPFDVVKTRRQMVHNNSNDIAARAEEVLINNKGSCDHHGLKEYTKSNNQQQSSCKHSISSTGTKTSSSAAIVGQRRTNAQNMNIFGHMKQIIEQEGISGLWKGNVTRMVKVAPACAIMISCYEFGKRVFGEVL